MTDALSEALPEQPPPATREVTTVSSREAVLQARLTDLCAQAQRCIVVDEETAETATTIGVAISAQIKALDEDRQTLVRPLNGVVADINGRYKRLAEPAEMAILYLGGSQSKIAEWNAKNPGRKIAQTAGQLTLWNAKKRREAEEKAIAAAKELEETRLREAQEAEAIAKAAREKGDAEGAAIATQVADEALQAAVEEPAAVKPIAQPTRGAMGGSSSSLRIWKFRITNMADLLAHELANVKAGKGLSHLMANESALGKLARATGPKPEIPGVEFYQEDSSSFR